MSSIALSLRSSYISSIDDSIPPWWEAQAEHILRGTDLQPFDFYADIARTGTAALLLQSFERGGHQS